MSEKHKRLEKNIMDVQIMSLSEKYLSDIDKICKGDLKSMSYFLLKASATNVASVLTMLNKKERKTIKKEFDNHIKSLLKYGDKKDLVGEWKKSNSN